MENELKALVLYSFLFLIFQLYFFFSFSFPSASAFAAEEGRVRRTVSQFFSFNVISGFFFSLCFPLFRRWSLLICFSDLKCGWTTAIVGSSRCKEGWPKNKMCFKRLYYMTYIKVITFLTYVNPIRVVVLLPGNNGCIFKCSCLINDDVFSHVQ